jgi:Flp pilus assembly protein TadG
MLRQLVRDRRGATVVEFALISPFFLVLLCGIVENGLILFTQAAMDNGTRDAARVILLGNATQDAFKAAFCATAGALVPCSEIQINVQSASKFSSISSTLQTDASGNMLHPQFSPGISSQAVLVQVGYNRPFMIPLIGAFSGRDSELLISTVALKSEPYGG